MYLRVLLQLHMSHVLLWGWHAAADACAASSLLVEGRRVSYLRCGWLQLWSSLLFCFE
jgi:hypothetical protein